ncbi:MAG: 3-deoxy-manno-octulosonate cytidylyltransferase [Candidatus Delongbacteria bacterium]|nr:3-deoxy-manno-octulosonate cytidylyltransferase [Candidatus Delongbacteria bacterium]MBN2836761.1 3-deoxy-manno-octulosonate cytidylyltransferase [Candidatus Delongbacteria bacterium]
MNKIYGVIPARFGSTRFPGKPLALISGKTMIRRVVEQVLKSKLIQKVLVATDDERIMQEIVGSGAIGVMTHSDLPTGTDRVLAALNNDIPDIVVNIQGDEPLISPEIIDNCIGALLDAPSIVCSTPVTNILDKNELANENIVKVLFDKNYDALYFSRSAIPFVRKVPNEKNPFYKHIGLYAYRTKFLQQFVQMPQTELEMIESLEQLRILENGYKIKCIKTDYSPCGIDIYEDISKVEKLLESIE